MANLLIDDRDQKFILFDQLKIDKLSESEKYSGLDRDTCEMLLNEAKKIAENETKTTNSICDTKGVKFENGKVKVPEEFHRLWKLWNEGEWRGLDIPAEFGGQGMPFVLGMAANEYFEAGNLAFQTLAAMTRGAALLIFTHGTEAQRVKYAKKILAGQWTGTMVLTEANAGSDVGATETTAEKNNDGTYSIKGSKVFITGGDTDLTENIIHLTLARIKGAPSGTKGLSLFLVPSVKINEDGSPGEPNDVKTIAVEQKLGLKGSPTCQLIFGEDSKCTGERIGRENEGMKIFFTMMNESRLIAARHGASVASTAYLHALNYAKERFQGSDPDQQDEKQCPIIRHPDVRRMLLMMKSYTEGIRALILYTSFCIDMERIANTETERVSWRDRLALLTPVTKAYCTDMSFRVTETAMQVYGGYGYTKDYPVEQFLRDEKVHSIFEGTNGIQANTLTGRELKKHQNELFNGLLKEITDCCKKNSSHPEFKNYISILNNANDTLIDLSKYLIELLVKDPKAVALYSVQYLEIFGDVITGWLLMQQAVIVQNKLNEAINGGKNNYPGINSMSPQNINYDFFSGKIASAKFFVHNNVNMIKSKAHIIKKTDKTVLKITENMF